MNVNTQFLDCFRSQGFGLFFGWLFLAGFHVLEARAACGVGWCRSVTQGRCLENWGYLGGWVESGAENIAGSVVLLDPNP